MLDVHAPEHPIGNVREFLIHLFTITVGLLIALGLENAAEAIHHRHERQEAEVMIRQELQENRKDLLAGEPALEAEIKNMRGILAFAQARSQHQNPNPGSLDMSFHGGVLQDAAWRTANSTGAISFMSYDQVERLAAAYKEQDLLQTMINDTLNDYAEFSSFTPVNDRYLKTVSPEDATAALPYARHALAHLEGMYFVGVGTLRDYDDALKP